METKPSDKNEAVVKKIFIIVISNGNANATWKEHCHWLALSFLYINKTAG